MADDVTQEELVLAGALPASHINRMISLNFPNGIRLALAEQVTVAGPPEFRFVAFLSYEDALALAELLIRQAQTGFVPAEPDGKTAPAAR